MIAWLGDNIGTIAVLLVLGVIVGLVIWNYIKDKKQHKHSCTGCAGCALSGKCNHAKNK